MKIFRKFILIIIWIACVSISLLWNNRFIDQSVNNLAKNTGESFFNEIVNNRAWNASFKGVYVPVSEEVEPNPYLKVKNRDLYIDSLDLKLTLINPAYMTRQMAEITALNSDVNYHITSLNPIRPENKADQWETIQLQKFEIGENEAFEFIEVQNNYRYMAPLIVKESCLNCHKQQGYSLGEIRGGISVSISAEKYTINANKQKEVVFWVHILIALFIAVIIFLYQYKFNNQLSKIEITNSLIGKQNADLQRAQFDLKRTANELKRSNLAKDRFFSIIAHDLKSPFSVIMGMSEVQMEDIEENNFDNVYKHSQLIKEESNKVFGLITNLLEWARTQTDHIPFKIEALDFSKIINEVVKLYTSQLEKKNIRIIIESNPEIIAEYDKQMILTVLRNLVSNAIKFTNECGSIQIISSKTKRELICQIIDDGIGMDKEDIDKLFKIDQHITKEGTNNERGTGLGLILCKEFIDKHHGKLNVFSKKGQGTKFTFSIPLKHDEDA